MRYQDLLSNDAGRSCQRTHGLLEKSAFVVGCVSSGMRASHRIFHAERSGAKDMSGQASIKYERCGKRKPLYRTSEWATSCREITLHRPLAVKCRGNPNDSTVPSTHRSSVSESNLLDIVGRHTFPHAPLFHICPALTGILRHKHKPLPLRHAPFRVAPCLVVIHCLDIPEFLRASFRCNSRAFFLGRAERTARQRSGR